MTFEEIYSQAMKAVHEDPDVNIELLENVKIWINERYRAIWDAIRNYDPTFIRSEGIISTVAKYNTGTVTINGTTTVTGDGTTFTSAMVGRKFQIDGSSEIYKIAAYVSSTEITLDAATVEDDDDELSYAIYQDEYDLPSDCDQVSVMYSHLSSTPLDKIGISEMREEIMSGNSYSDESATYYPTKWAYLTDSEIIVSPHPTTKVNLRLDYIISITELSDDDDEPLLPENLHGLIVTGTKADLYRFNDDAINANLWENLFVNGINNLTMRTILDTDNKIIRPVVHRS